MLIGIDMLGVQSPESGEREAGRYGRQLVEGLTARDTSNRYVLYTHERLPIDRVPTGRHSLRVSLAPVPSRSVSRLRSTTQRLLDLNPDGLDWLVLLDPFAPDYGGIPPESPLNRVKVASVVHDLASAIADDRVLAPLRRHDAILAVAESTAVLCRQRLGLAANRVSTIGVASDATFAAPGVSEPMTRVSGDELGCLGIHGPFLFASLVSGSIRSNLLGILDTYHRLPIDSRRKHRLVIAGAIDEPGEARRFLYDRGCDDGLILVGDVSERSLRTLYGRCSAFLAPSFDAGSGLSLVEAMRCGAVVMAGREGNQARIVGDAGILVDPSNPGEIAAELAALLGDADQSRDLRRRATDRSTLFCWEPVIEAVVLALTADTIRPSNRRLRFDQSHAVRPRIAVFPSVTDATTSRVDLASQVPTEWRQAFNVDLYLDARASSLADGLPTEFGGFDDRQFDRNDRLLNYHAVVYRFDSVTDLEAKLAAIARRPGLIFLSDYAFLDLVDADALASSTAHARLCDHRSDHAVGLLREVFDTGSRLAVQSVYHQDRIKAAIFDHSHQLVLIPPSEAVSPLSEDRRSRARQRLDLRPETLVIGHFGGSTACPIHLANADAVLLTFDSGSGQHQSSRMGSAGDLISDGVLSPVAAADLVAVLDLAIHAGEPASIRLLDLLKAGVPTVAVGSGFPENVVHHVDRTASFGEINRAVSDLAGDLEARRTLSLSALAFLRGAPDAGLASRLLIDEIATCASDLGRDSGRRLRRPTEASRGLPHVSPHNRPSRGERR